MKLVSAILALALLSGCAAQRNTDWAGISRVVGAMNK